MEKLSWVYDSVNLNTTLPLPIKLTSRHDKQTGYEKFRHNRLQLSPFFNFIAYSLYLHDVSSLMGRYSCQECIPVVQKPTT